MTTFFSLDGSYGDANNLFVTDTTQWTLEDWEEIDLFLPSLLKSIGLYLSQTNCLRLHNFRLTKKRWSLCYLRVGVVVGFDKVGVNNYLAFVVLVY